MPLASHVFPALFVFLWATGFIGARYAMPWAEPFSFLSARFFIAFGLLGLLTRFVTTKPWTRQGALHAMIAGVLMHGFYLGGVFWAVRNGMPAGLSALLIGLQPLVTAFIAVPALGETVERRHWIGLVAGLIGVTIVLAPNIDASVNDVTVATFTATCIAVLGMTIGTIWQKRFVSDLDLVSGTMFQYLGGALLMTAFALALETGEFTWSLELVFAMVWLVLVLSIGAIFVLMYMIREGEVSRVATLFYLVPAVTAIIAWFLFDETLTLFQIGGMALACAGVALATRRTD